MEEMTVRKKQKLVGRVRKASQVMMKPEYELSPNGESINLGAPARFLVWGPPSITSEPPLLDGNLPSNYRGPRNGFLLICGAPERRSGAFRLTFTACK
jgi:hypothetical protein